VYCATKLKILTAIPFRLSGLETGRSIHICAIHVMNELPIKRTTGSPQEISSYIALRLRRMIGDLQPEKGLVRNLRLIQTAFGDTASNLSEFGAFLDSFCGSCLKPVRIRSFS
jgi:hypothetical protein